MIERCYGCGSIDFLFDSGSYPWWEPASGGPKVRIPLCDRCAARAADLNDDDGLFCCLIGVRVMVDVQSDAR